MKFAWRVFEKLAHWIGLFIAIAAIVAVGVIIGRPAEKGGNQPGFVGAEQQQKRLAVFLDGTWNTVDGNTNVWRMRSVVRLRRARMADPQLVYYSVGVNGFLGGLFGQGVDENVELAYEWLIENYRDGDEIYILASAGERTPQGPWLRLVSDQRPFEKRVPPSACRNCSIAISGATKKAIWRLREMQAADETSKMTDQEGGSWSMPSPSTSR